jgi:large conductance mechanosensitive channel protein
MIMEIPLRVTPLRGFFDFVREQGVVGLAVGFILGGSVSKVVSSLVADIVNPLVAVVIGTQEGLAKASFRVFGQDVMWGNFASNLIDFVVIAAVVYFGVKIIGINRLDKKAEPAKA